jgi:hypothetical protein
MVYNKNKNLNLKPLTGGTKMSFWEDWKVEESELTDVVGVEEKDFDPIKALAIIARVLKDERKLSKSIIVQNLLALAAEDKSVQIIFINMLHDGFDSVMQDALLEAQKAMALEQAKSLGGTQQ